MKEQLNHSDADRRQLDQQATSYKLQIEELRRQFDDTAHERDRSKTALESSNYERTNMEKIRLVSFSSDLFIDCLIIHLDIEQSNRFFTCGL